MAIDKTGKVLAQFNVKNGQYKVADGEIKPLAWLTRISLDKELSTLPLYGDGEVIVRMVNDKGFTGILGLTARDIEFEIANGMQMEIDGGIAEIQQQSVPQNSIYFETEYTGSDGIKKTKKVWLFGVEISAPSESLEQTTEDLNIANVEYGITVKGVYLKDSESTTDYTDPETGNKVKVFKMSKVPTDTDYATFGDTVPVPTAKAGTPPSGG